jgi:hypothetical protein
MNTFKNMLSTRLVIAISVLAISTFAIHSSLVQGKPVLKPSAGTTPVNGAKVTLTPVAGTGAATAAVYGITTANGSFTISGLVTGHYTLTITPAITVSTSGQSFPPPFQAWANFNTLRGLTVNNIIANTAPTGPIPVMTNGSLNIVLFAFGKGTSTVTGTLTK